MIKTQKSIFDNKQNKFATTIFTFAIAFYMIANAYVLPFFTSLAIGELIVVPLVALLFFAKKKNITTESDKAVKILICFCFYSFIISLFSVLTIGADINEVGKRLLRDLFYYCLIFVFVRYYIDFSYFKVLVKKITIVLGAFVILQFLVYNIFGYFIPGFVLNAIMNDGQKTGIELYNLYLRSAKISGYLKPNGFLCEPSHCAHCFFAGLLLFLFDKKNNNRTFFCAIFLTIATVCTMSTSGFLEIIIAWVSWMVVKRKIVPILLLLSFVLFTILVAGFKPSFLSSYTSVVNRFLNVFKDGGDNISMSATRRIVKGFEVFGALPLDKQIFGIGFGSYDAAFEKYLISSAVSDASSDFMNTFSYILVSSGGFGLLMFMSFFLCLFTTRNTLGKIAIIGLLILFLGTTIYNNAFYLWFMTIILMSNKKGGIECEKNPVCFTNVQKRWGRENIVNCS